MYFVINSNDVSKWDLSLAPMLLPQSYVTAATWEAWVACLKLQPGQFGFEDMNTQFVVSKCCFLILSDSFSCCSGFWSKDFKVQ